MKRFLAVAAIIATIICSGGAAAQSQTNLETGSAYPTGYIKAGYPYEFGTKDGVLFVFMGDEPFILVKYPADSDRESYTIPQTVTRIARGAFQGCRNLKELIIPAGLFYVGDNAFDDAEIEKFVVKGNDMSYSPTVKQEATSGESRYYDVTGRRLSEPTAGINIIVEDGKAHKAYNNR